MRLIHLIDDLLRDPASGRGSNHYLWMFSAESVYPAIRKLHGGSFIIHELPDNAVLRIQRRLRMYGWHQGQRCTHQSEVYM